VNKPRAGEATLDVSADHGRDIDVLLEYLKRTRSFDFTGYKRPSLTRRINKRMQAIGVDTYEQFVDVIERNPSEFDQLCNTVLINVTAFFRDGVPWDSLASEIIPRLLEAKSPTDPIRVWSAGCATGEEAYTLAIVLAEAIGLDAFRERVKIYATDVDEQALSIARYATYNATEVEGVPPDYLERYFERHDNRYTFRKDLRRFVIFGRNDLIQDAPISRIDLLVCRNTLMYFNSATQSKILARFHFALSDTGYLLLGRAETLLAHNTLFSPVDLKRRIFVKVPRVNYRTRLLAMTVTPDEQNGGTSLPTEARLKDASWEASPHAQIVVDASGILIAANERARSAFGLGNADLARPFHDLELSYRPAELRSVIDQAYTERKGATLRAVEWPTRGELRWMDIQVTPIYDGTRPLGASIGFNDVTAFQQLHRELEKSNAELESAYEELQSTNEELETTNEELQSTVEELETTNEELQSTNEELETMNEELQSTNEELTTINDELRRRSDELNEVNDFMESVLRSLRGGVAVLDTELRIEAWNERAYDLWGVRGEEVRGQHFMMLDIGLPVQSLAKTIRGCLAGDSQSEETSVAAINRRGKSISCKVTCTPMQRGTDGKIRGVIVVMEDEGQAT
jgi:two-component system CheB/CheR fusion protein